jgi:hypothetical protein
MIPAQPEYSWARWYFEMSKLSYELAAPSYNVLSRKDLA